MKVLMFPEMGKQVVLSEPRFITLVIENPQILRAYGYELFSGFGEKSERFRLIEDGKTLYLDEHGYFLPNLFELDLNSKRNVNSLVKLLKKSYFESLSESVKDIQHRIEEAVDAIRLDFDVEIESDFSLKTDDVFKIANIKFSEDCNNHVERLIRFLAVENELHGSTILFVVHLREFFSEEEIEAIKRETSYRGWTIVDIETRASIPVMEDEHLFILDKDLCVI